MARAETIASHGPSGSGSARSADDVARASPRRARACSSIAAGAVEQGELRRRVARAPRRRRGARAGAEVEHAAQRALAQAQRVDRGRVEGVEAGQQAPALGVVALGVGLEDGARRVAHRGGPVEPRTTSSAGSTIGRRGAPAGHALPRAARRRVAPSSSASSATVVSGGSSTRAKSMSSKPIDREVARDAQPALARGQVEAGGDDVVVAEHGGRLLVEQRAGRVAGVVDGDRGQRARQRVGVEAGLGQHAPAGVLAQVEGGGVEGGGEVADAAMAELEQVLEGGRGAALGVEAHRRAPRRPASMSTTCSSGRQRLGRHRPRTAGSRRPGRRAAPRRTAPPSGGRCRCRPAPPCSRPPAPRAGRRAGRGEERVGHVGDQQRDRPRAPQAQRLRGDVGPVAELARARGARFSCVAADTRPRPLPENTSETVDCDTPARLRHVDARHAGVGGGGDGGHATTPEGAVGREAAPARRVFVV